MATNRNDQNRGGRRGSGRAPGVFRTVGNPLYRTNPQTGNLEIVNEFDVPLEQQPLPVVPPAPVAQPPAAVEPEPEPEPEPAPAPSPLEGIFADGGTSTETTGETSSPDATAAAPDTTASTTSASKNTGIGQNVGMGLGAGIGGIPGAVAGAIAGDFVESAIRGAFGQQTGVSAGTPGEPVGGLNTADFNSMNLGQPGAFGEPGLNTQGFDPANLGNPTDPDFGSVDMSDVDATANAGAPDSAAPGGTAPDSAAPGANDDSNAGDTPSGAGEATGGDTSSSDGGGTAGGGSSNDGGDSTGGGWAAGGLVTQDRLQGPDPAGPDTGYGALQHGEFVVNAQAAQQNAGLLETINAQGAMQGAPEVITMRWFFENVLPRTPQGQAFAARLDEAGPVIEQALAQRQDAPQILQHILGSYMQPAAEAVRRGDHGEAVRIYGELGTYAAQLAAEAEQLDPAIEQMLEEFAQESAEVAHDGELAGLATATGNDLVHPGDQVENQPGSRLGRIFVGG